MNLFYRKKTDDKPSNPIKEHVKSTLKEVIIKPYVRPVLSVCEIEAQSNVLKLKLIGLNRQRVKKEYIFEFISKFNREQQEVFSDFVSLLGKDPDPLNIEGIYHFYDLRQGSFLTNRISDIVVDRIHDFLTIHDDEKA